MVNITSLLWDRNLTSQLS